MNVKKAVLVLVLAACPSLASAQVHRGPEFQVNAFMPGAQKAPSIASDAAGNFVVVWHSYDQEGDAGVFGRRFDVAGNPIGPEFRVNTYTTGDQWNPSVAMDPSGNMIVVWESAENAPAFNIYARRYDAAGNPDATGPFRVNATTTGNHIQSKVAAAGDGSFTVVWTDEEDGSQLGVSARHFDAAGVPGPEFRVNTYTTNSQAYPGVAADLTGNFVIVWASAGQDGSSTGVVGRRYDSSGAPAGPEFPVNTYTTSTQDRPSVAMAGDGRFMVVWHTYGQDLSTWGIAGRRFAASGLAEGPDDIVNLYHPNTQLRPSVAADGRGDFIVAWESFGQNGSGGGDDVFARRYDAAGSPEPEFQVNTYTFGSQARPTVAAASNGDFVVAWQSQNQDAGAYGIFGQRLSPDLIFKDGFESGTLQAWSASATDGGNLTASASAGLRFSLVGLEGVVDDTNPLYVEDDLPHDEDRYRARFYFDPNGFDPGQAQGHLRSRIFLALEETPTRRLAAVVLKRQGTSYSLMGRCRLDDGSQADTGFIPITDAEHEVEIDWKRSTGPSASDGRFELFLDGVSVSVLSNLNNSASSVDFARLGALSVKAGASGTMFWDEFQSRRLGYIGQ
jgi:hypothetical protein